MSAHFLAMLRSASDGAPMTKALKRSGGRRARVALRAAPPKTNPAPAGQRGGLYKPLSESDLNAIYDTALKLLS